MVRFGNLGMAKKMRPLKVPNYSCPECYLLLSSFVQLKNPNNPNVQDDFIVFKHTAERTTCPYDNYQINIPLYRYISDDFNALI